MPLQLDPGLHELLQRRLIATLGTENVNGSIHLTAVWFLFENNSFYIATSSKTKKARNILANPKASLMVDMRKPGTERGLTAACKAELLSGDLSKQLNRRIHSRYLSSAAMADPRRCLHPGVAGG